MFRNPILGAGGSTLLRPAIQSPNYSPGAAGWAVKRDGSAEFNNVVIRGGTVVSGKALYYDGTPANGNLIMSLSPSAGTDAFGNDYLAGIVTYSGGSFAALNVGNLLLGLVASPTDAGLVGLTGGDGVFAASPSSALHPASATWELVDGDTGVTPTSSSNYPHFDVGASTAGVTGWINGAWVRSSVSAGTSTAETWHAPSPYSANWSGSTSFGTISGGMPTLQYRFDAEDNTWLLGAFTAASGAGTLVFNLPAAYRPKKNCAIPVAFVSSGGTAGNAWLYVSAAGNLNINTQLGSAVTAGTTYFVNGKIPLGNVG